MALDRILDWSLAARGFRSHRTTLSGVDVHHRVRAGRRNVGPAIVLVHGIGSSSAHYHDTLLRLARTGRPIYALDLPGHGRSGELPDSSQSPTHALEEILDEYLARVVGGRFVLVGNSLGGALVVHHAWTRPERVVGVVATSPAIGIRSPEDWAELRSRLLLDTHEHAERFVESVFHRPPPGLGLLARSFRRAMNRPTVRRLLDLVDVADFAPPPPKRTPMLVVWGRSERVFTPRMLEGLKLVMPPHVLVEEPGHVGHCPHLDAAGWFAERVSTFIDEIESRPDLRAAHIG